MATFVQLTTVFVIYIVCIKTQDLLDNRCYLENGASAESFFVSEDLQVGSVIGQLRVHGDPRPIVGNIVLRLKEIDSPVDVLTGSRNLTLRRRLDKEGRDGPSSVYVNVICERLHTNDPGFVIPVNIRVTDANDNAPRFVNAPYVLNISEVTVVGTRVLQGVRAEDDDQQGPYSTVRYSVLPGLQSDYFVFENELEGTLVLRRPLDYETLKTFTVGVRAQDQGNPPQQTDTILQVNVIDADDQNPRFVDERYTAFLPEPPLKGTLIKIQPREVKAYDQDTGINAAIFYTFNFANADYRLFEIGRENGRVLIKRDIKDDELLQPTTLVIRATQQDNPDRYALATLTISRVTSTTRDIRFLQRIYHVTAPENLPGGSIIATLGTNHPRDDLRYYVSDQHLLEVFTIDSSGELALRKQLDYETRDSYVFKVFVTDGKTNDSSVVNISVINVNDWEPRFRYPQYEFFVSRSSLSADDLGETGRLVGRVEAADGDRGDVVHLALTGPNASMFTINSLGEIRLRSPLIDPMPATPLHLTAMATDSGRPQRQTSVPVTVHFPQQSFSAASDSVGNAGDWPQQANNNGGLLLVMVFGALLVLLAVVIAVLVMYICKVKKPRVRPKLRSDYLDHEKPPLSSVVMANNQAGKMENPMFGDSNQSQRAANVIATAMGGVPSDVYTATVKSIMSRNGTVRTTSGSNSRLISPKIHPAPSPPREQQNDAIVGTIESLNNLGSGLASSQQHQQQLHQHRIKKLSWGDHPHNNKTDMMNDSVENVNNIDTTNLDPVQRIVDNSNLTVYF